MFTIKSFIHTNMDKQIEYYQNKLNYEMDPSDLHKAMEQGENVVPLDTRRAAAYGKQHIPGAISLPHREINADSTKELDRSKLYVCYCNGIGCNASTWGALKLAKLGFNVKELTGGIQWWKFDGHHLEGTEKGENVSVECAC